MVETQSTIDLPTRDAALAEIAARTGVRAERGRRFAELTSLKVGGAIDWVLLPQTEAQAAALVAELERAGIAWRVLGAGSNVLADDAPHHYVVLSMREVKGEV
jgi:UDP-N-acetylmuramate dehydrogenase